MSKGRWYALAGTLTIYVTALLFGYTIGKGVHSMWTFLFIVPCLLGGRLIVEGVVKGDWK